MTRLSVNINKVALLRNSRKGNFPDLIQVAKDCEAFGAQGITVHPRPDERHIRYSDVSLLKEVVKTEFNIEGYPNRRFMDLVTSVKPDQCTLVPDPPGVLTSDTGWDTVEQQEFLKDVISELKDAGIRVSLFLDPHPKMVTSAKQCGADRIELYTGEYAHHYNKNPRKAVADHVNASKEAQIIGIGLNAGHDLNLRNLKFYKQQVINLLEVSIGHALIADAIYYGLQNTIQMYMLRLE